MTTFLLIRHSHTDAIGRRFAGSLADVQLSSEGRRQASLLAHHLSEAPLRAVYSSPVVRACETASVIAEPHALPVVTLPALDELRAKRWEGEAYSALDEQSDWQQWNRFRSGHRAGGGETMAEVQARMVSAMLDARAAYPESSLALVSHGDPIRAVLTYWLGMPVDHYHRIDIDPGSVSVLTLNDHAVHVRALNHTQWGRFSF